MFSVYSVFYMSLWYVFCVTVCGMFCVLVCVIVYRPFVCLFVVYSVCASMQCMLSVCMRAIYICMCNVVCVHMYGFCVWDASRTPKVSCKPGISSQFRGTEVQKA